MTAFRFVPTAPWTMNYIKFGNHVIAPAGTDPIPSPLPSPSPSPMPTPRPLAPAPASDPTELLPLAHLLQSKIKELENTVAERKARRQEWRTGVSRLDKILVGLREQEGKDGDKLAKLLNQRNKANGLPTNPHRYFSENPGLFGLPFKPETTQEQQDWFVCPTTQTASAYNAVTERYMDSYTFDGQPAAWQQSTPALHSGSPSWISDWEGRGSFRFVMSPEGLLDRSGIDKDDESPTKKHRTALGDIRNTVTQEEATREGEVSRKRKSQEFEDGPHKKMREEVPGETGKPRYIIQRRDFRRRSNGRG